jgi:hypothetical protein
MPRLVLVAAFAAFLGAVASAETTAELRQPAIDACAAAAAGTGDAAKAEGMCVCIINGVITSMPGEDAVKILKIFIANPVNDAGIAQALGVSEAEGKAFLASHAETLSKTAIACGQ